MTTDKYRREFFMHSFAGMLAGDHTVTKFEQSHSDADEKGRIVNLARLTLRATDLAIDVLNGRTP